MADNAPSKRARRTDSATMWNSSEADRPKGGNKPRDRDQETRNRERPRSRDRDRERDRERRNPENSREHRDAPHKDRNGNRRRSRSRSPMGDARGQRNRRARSPRDSRVKDEGEKSNGIVKGSRSEDKAVKSGKPDGAQSSRSTHTKNSAGVQDDDDDDEAARMRSMMGFAGFRSTKQTKVPGNDWYAVRKVKETKYRQYMNRQGGFNRPLSPSR